MSGLLVKVFLCNLLLFSHGLDDQIIRPPSITSESPSMIMFRNQQLISLLCDALGTPNPTFSWTFNGAPLDFGTSGVTRPDPSQGTIVITEAGQINEGFYQCSATNDFGTALSTVTELELASIGGVPPNPDPAVKNVGQGEFMKIDCGDIQSTPLPEYSWQLADDVTDRNPRGFSTSQRVLMDPLGNLYFTNVLPGDAQGGDLYLCNAFNTWIDTTVGISYTQVSVAATPTPPLSAPDNQYQTSSPALGIVGQTITLTCIFSGNPTPTLSWSKEGAPVSGGRIEYDQFNSQLIINNIQHEDAGTYTCQGVNSMGTETEQIVLNVEEIPFFYAAGDGPENMNVTVGDDVNIMCNATGIPTPAEQWMINGSPLNVGNPPERMSVSTDGLMLTVTDVCKTCTGARNTDLMVIQCNASNVHGWTFGDGYLNVLLPTVITVSPPTDVNLGPNTAVTLECSGTSDPSTPVFPIWYVDGAPVVDNPPYIQQQPDGSLLIDTSGYEDWQLLEGTYACNLTNGFSSDTAYVTVGQPTVVAATLPWWVFLLIALVIIILIIIGAVCYHINKNPGADYLVDANERKQGLDPEKDCRDMDHVEHVRTASPVSKPPAEMMGLQAHGPRLGLDNRAFDSPYKYGDSEQGSLNEYGDVSFGKFNEDGSFIGQYNTVDPTSRDPPRVLVNPGVNMGVDNPGWRRY